MSLPAAPWSRPAADVAGALGVDPAVGLYSGQVALRVRRDGPNRLLGVKARSLAAILWAQLRSLLVGLLALAAGIGFVFGDTVEGYAILVVIALNTAIGFFSELQAVRSMEALRRLGVTICRVRRDGALRELPAEALVAGDIVLLEGSDLVPADLRMLDGARAGGRVSAYRRIAAGGRACRSSPSCRAAGRARLHALPRHGSQCRHGAWRRDRHRHGNRAGQDQPPGGARPGRRRRRSKNDSTALANGSPGWR